MNLPQHIRPAFPRPAKLTLRLLMLGASVCLAVTVQATPSNRAALDKHFDRFLAKDLNRCTTCHLPTSVKNPENLDDIPHNPFGDRLRALGEELEDAGKPKDLVTRLQIVADEDSDGDGVPNEAELLLGSAPGDAKQAPAAEQLAKLEGTKAEFSRFLASYRWQPFDRVNRPAIPKVANADWVRTPIDAFVAAEHEARGLKPRPMAPKATLLRRVYLDLIGLTPMPEEQKAFEEDLSSDAYEKVVDRLLADPRYGERWGRHWMDVWRYSDWAGWTDGKQIRDSQRHIWRWRDWIIESLNADKGYDRMVTEMLAADELSPNDPDTLRATGFLVRNYKMLSREQWMEDTVKHTSQAFLGITVGCAKCHDHMYDPVSQAEYYQIRAIFEPHTVRIDRVPGELDREKDGLARVFDVNADAPTYFLIRGDERKPDKDRVMQPGVPKALCISGVNHTLSPEPVKLPKEAVAPDRRDFVLREIVTASDTTVTSAREALAKEKADPNTNATKVRQRELELADAETKHLSLVAVLNAEAIEEQKGKESEEWKAAAKEATSKQRVAGTAEGYVALHKAVAARDQLQQQLDAAITAAAPDGKVANEEKLRKDLEAAAKKATEAEQAVAKLEEQMKAEPDVAFKPREAPTYADKSTGRRLAFAKWIASENNPLTARVAANHIWLRHFGRGIVATPEDFGRSGARPSHAALLDWLAAELMKSGWKMKPIHRMLVTSSTYRMASTPDGANAAIDQDNIYLWRMPSRRMEAELVRDNLLYVTGSLDPKMGGSEIDYKQGLTSKRRSVYLQLAAEKEVEFMKIFDGPSVTECYQRRPSVLPQQALAMSNSELSRTQARALTAALAEKTKDDDAAFIQEAFTRILARPAKADELELCRRFLKGESETPRSEIRPVSNAENPEPNQTQADRSPARLRENLILVLLNHNDFVTIR